METTINIATGTVLSRVRTMSEYMGAKLLPKDEAAYERISAIEADDALLSSFIPGVMSRLSVNLGRHSRGVTVSDTTVTLNMDLSNGHPKTLISDMTADMESYLVFSLLSEWLTVAAPGMETSYPKKAEAFADDLRRKASFKVNPTN